MGKKTPKRKQSTDELDAKIELITAMNTTLGKLTNVEMRLRDVFDFDRAELVKAKHDELRDAIDTLRGQVADQWTRDTEDLHEGLRQANEKVQASIRNIQKKINVAENVIKVIGWVDKGLAAVQGLVRKRRPKGN